MGNHAPGIFNFSREAHRTGRVAQLHRRIEPYCKNLMFMPSLTLYELNARIKKTVKSGFPEPIWITAEIAEMQMNRSGHCYLQLADKREGSDEHDQYSSQFLHLGVNLPLRLCSTIQKAICRFNVSYARFE